MIPKYREQYNKNFSEKQYERFVAQINQAYPGQLDFRMAETPVFATSVFRDKMINVCEEVVDLITDKDFITLTQQSIPKNLLFKNDESLPQMMVFDFGV